MFCQRGAGVCRALETIVFDWVLGKTYGCDCVFRDVEEERRVLASVSGVQTGNGSGICGRRRGGHGFKVVQGLCRLVHLSLHFRLFCGRHETVDGKRKITVRLVYVNHIGMLRMMKMLLLLLLVSSLYE